MYQKINTSYGKLRVYMSKPGTHEHIMIVPGYSESVIHHKELVDRLAKKGSYTVFTFSQPRGGTRNNPLDRQQEIILNVLAATVPDSTKVHAVAHSLGSASLLRAAKKSPEQFASLLLMQPSGMIGKQHFLQMTRRVGIKTANNYLNARKSNRLRGQESESGPMNMPYSLSLRRIISTQLASSGLIAKSPLLAFREAMAAMAHDIAEDIETVQKSGIPVTIVKAHGDELFSMKDRLDYDQIIKLAGSYSSISDKNAGHDTFWIHPEQTAQLIDTFIRHSLAK